MNIRPLFFLHLQAIARLSSFECDEEPSGNGGSLSSQSSIWFNVRIWAKGNTFGHISLESPINPCFENSGNAIASNFFFPCIKVFALPLLLKLPLEWLNVKFSIAEHLLQNSFL